MLLEAKRAERVVGLFVVGLIAVSLVLVFMLLRQRETVVPVGAQPTMRDVLKVSTDVAGLMREMLDPQGPYQRILHNMEKITTRVAKEEEGSRVYRDARRIAASFGDIIEGEDAVPVTLTEESQLIVNLSAKLDEQTDIFVEVARKMDAVADRVLAKETMAGALLSDPVFYAEMLDFLRETKILLSELRYLTKSLRVVVPELPGLIKEGRRDLAEMGKVLRGLQGLPFLNIPKEPDVRVDPMQVTLHGLSEE